MIKIPLRRRTYTTLENEVKFFSRLGWVVGEKTDERWQETNKPLVGNFYESLNTFDVASPVEFQNYLFNIFSFGIEASGQVMKSANASKIMVTYNLPIMSALKFFVMYCSPLLFAYQNVSDYYFSVDDVELNLGLLVIGGLSPVLGLWLIDSQTNFIEKKIIDLFGLTD